MFMVWCLIVLILVCFMVFGVYGWLVWLAVLRAVVWVSGGGTCVCGVVYCLV